MEGYIKQEYIKQLDGGTVINACHKLIGELSYASMIKEMQIEELLKLLKQKDQELGELKQKAQKK